MLGEEESIHFIFINNTVPEDLYVYLVYHRTERVDSTMPIPELQIEIQLKLKYILIISCP